MSWLHSVKQGGYIVNTLSKIVIVALTIAVASCMVIVSSQLFAKISSAKTVSMQVLLYRKRIRKNVSHA